MAEVFCGFDWGEQSHLVALVDVSGRLIAGGRIEDSPLGYAALMGMLAGAGDRKRRPVPVAAEAPHGLIISALVQAGRPVYAINPLLVARYRERHSVAGRKSDAGDALVLANILRTDRHLHHLVPGDSELVRAITVVARAHQDAVNRRTGTCRHLRIVLRGYFPAFLQAFGPRMDGLYKMEARLMLGTAPTPALAAHLTPARIASVLQKAGRKRRVGIRVREIMRSFATPQLRQPELVEQAMSDQAIALLEIVDTETSNIDTLAIALDKLFRQHPDREVICYQQLFAHFHDHKDALGVERVARLEWAYLPALGFQANPRMLSELLARDPSFFVEVVSSIYRQSSAEDAGRHAVTGPAVWSARVTSQLWPPSPSAATKANISHLLWHRLEDASRDWRYLPDRKTDRWHGRSAYPDDRTCTREEFNTKRI